MAVTDVKTAAQCDTLFKDCVAKKIPFVILFGAEWSGYCKAAKDLLLKHSNNAKYSKVSFIYVDIDLCKGNNAGSTVTSIPHYRFYKNGTQNSELIGPPQDYLIGEKIDLII